MGYRRLPERPKDKNMSEKETKKIIVDVPKAVVDHMSQMREAMGLRSNADVVRYAIALLSTYVDARLKGHDVVITSDDERAERIVLPILTGVQSLLS